MGHLKATVLFLFFAFFGVSVMAQPTVGQKYLTLRNFNFSVQNNVDEQALRLVSTTVTSLNLHIQGSKMVSENHSVGVGLMGGINRVAPANSLSLQQTLSIGASVFVRQWFAVRKQFYLHLDLQTSISYSGGFASDKTFNAELGLMPGISWFFHPKWSLEGRLPGGQLYYRGRRTYFTADRVIGTSYNVNPLQMQFAISRFF